MRTPLVLTSLAFALAACGDDSAPAPGPASTQAPSAPAEAPEPAPPPADPNEACAEVLVVAWAGAAHASDAITRDRDAARARAEALHARAAAAGADFAALARAESDAASSGPRGGLIGTYARDEWPDAHVPIRDAVFALSVGAISGVLEAPYGFVVARRCAVEKIHTRHILVRFRGARNAGDDITRSEDEARARAAELRARAVAGDFEAVAREASEDASAARGGDVGTVGRGRLAPEYEAAAFALEPGGISEPIRTELGYHVIERVE